MARRSVVCAFRVYVGTLLLKDTTTSGRYVTVDRWRDVRAFLDFRSACSPQYAQLDQECGKLTVAEQRLGVFAALARSPLGCHGLRHCGWARWEVA